MKYYYLLFAIIIAHFLTPTGSLAENKDKPNILFILTDDQAPWAFSASGDPNANTPNMDKLAQNGAYFKNAFITTPVCSPSRHSIMTSQYASESDILDFIPHPEHRLYDPDYNPGINPNTLTFAEVLQKNGYKTGLVGKWHLGDWTLTNDKKYHPTNHGFDYFMGLTGGGTTPDDPPLEVDGEIKQFSGLTTDILTDYAIEFIKKNAGEQFLLCLNTRAPHGRWLPVADSDWEPFENMNPSLPNPDYPNLDKEKAKRKMREYLASTKGVDRNLGRIVNVLESLNLTKNTVVIFFSDHGYNMGHNGIEHKGNGIWITKTIPEDTKNIAGKYRPNLYDNSLKVPAIICWPGVVKPGTIIEKNISSLDIYPTIVEMAGAEAPEPNTHKVRGRSLIPLLKGENINDWNNNIYTEYSMINYCTAFLRSYRTSEWKLVRDFMNPERDELYHLAYDPEENINLIHSPGEDIRQIIDGLHQKILNKMEEINDPLLKEIKINKAYYK